MLKCAFNFQDPRGACFLFCGGMFPTKVYLAIACFLYASEEEYVVDSWWLFKYVWIYQSYSDFLCRLSIGFGTHWWWYLHVILQLAWNWRGGGTRPYLLFTLDLFHSSALFVVKKVVFLLIQKIVLYTIVLTRVLSVCVTIKLLY